MFNQFEMKTESLNRQMEFLRVLQRRHLAWAADTHDPEAKRKHLEIADALQGTLKQYEELLEISSLKPSGT